MLRSLLAQAQFYSIFARLVGASRGRRLYVERYIRPSVGDRVLDIGCGPAGILEALPEVDYHGFDISPEYIALARKQFGSRGQFRVVGVSGELVGKYENFDLVLATGVLHHLTDPEALALFQIARAALNPTGRLITLDGCFIKGQSRLARHFLEWDRGEYVRTVEGYVALARRVFSTVTPTVTSELLRIPYTHLVLECEAATDV
jgi:SAM-dependent methyltransferase